MGVADDGFAGVVEATFVWEVSKVLLEEVLFGSRVLEFDADFSGTVGEVKVLKSTTEAAAEGAWKATAVFDVRVRVNRVVVWVRACGLVLLQDGFRWTEQCRG